MDTIIHMCDQVLLRHEGADGIQPLIIEHYAKSDATWYTIGIVALVCVTIIVVALIVKSVFNCQKEHKKGQMEIENLKMRVDKLEGNIIEKDEVKNEYRAKLANFLEDLSKNEKNSKMKGIEDEACKKYINFLTDLAKNGCMTEYYLNNGVTKEKD